MASPSKDDARTVGSLKASALVALAFVLEALTGQLYLTILLAQLVSLELRSRQDG